MPIEDILKAYISHTEEEEVNVKEEVFETPYQIHIQQR